MLQSKHAPIDIGIVIANAEKTSAAMFALLIFQTNNKGFVALQSQCIRSCHVFFFQSQGSSQTRYERGAVKPFT